MNASDLADVAARLNLRRSRRSFRGNCPECGYRGAFCLKAGKGGRLLPFCFNGRTRDHLQVALFRATGQDFTPAPELAADEEEARLARNQAKAARLWSGSVLASGTPADTYLTRRALGDLATSNALRFRADVGHPEGGKYPALIAAVSDASGQIVAVHRTYLSRDGHKAQTNPTKASLGPTRGGAIRLNPAAYELVVGEGIETAASAGRLLGLPAWSAISAGNLASGLVLPQVVRVVRIAADADPCGRSAALAAQVRWRAEGRVVKIVTPDPGRGDFNDLLLERARREAPHA